MSKNFKLFLLKIINPRVGISNSLRNKHLLEKRVILDFEKFPISYK